LYSPVTTTSARLVCVLPFVSVATNCTQ
jgi:hypothetical protein